MTKSDVKNIARNLSKNEGFRRPLIIFRKSDDYYMKVYHIPYLDFIPPIIWVNYEVLQMNEQAVIGLLMHEYCHILLPKATEREVDIMVVAKGYGKHLHEFLKYHDKHYESYKKKEGLTRKEVRDYLKYIE